MNPWIQQAYETLSNTASRHRYDAGLSCSSSRTAHSTQHHATYHYHHPPFGDDDDEWEDEEWNEYDYEDGHDDDFFYDFIHRGGMPRFFDGRHYSTYEEMERLFREEERQEAAYRAADFAHRAEMRAENLEQHRTRGAEEATRKKAREEAKQAVEEDANRARENRKIIEREEQEVRWTKASAVTKDEKLNGCLHSEFCQKVPQRMKFKCNACSKKGGMTAFECPYRSSFLCQQCVTKFSERRAQGDEPKPQPEPEPGSDSEPGAERESERDAEPELRPKLVPGSYPKDEDFAGSQDRGNGVDGQVSKKAKKKNKKAKTAALADDCFAHEAKPSAPKPKLMVDKKQDGDKFASQKKSQMTKKATTTDGGLSEEPKPPAPKAKPAAIWNQDEENLGSQKKYQKAKKAGLVNNDLLREPKPAFSEARPVVNHRQDNQNLGRQTKNGAPINKESGRSQSPISPEQNPDEHDKQTTDPANPLDKAFHINGHIPQRVKCYVCHELDHYALNCPKVGRRNCYKCGEIGPLSRHCVKAENVDQTATTPNLTPTHETASPTRAFIRNATLARGITEPLLKQAMEAFGPVTAVKIDRRAGIAWADFVETEALSDAITASPVPVAKGAVKISMWRNKKPATGSVTRIRGG
ncbi:hypothetical protein BJ170DRAFT_693226 [Xylariales sp. AK1849]|nr:hypothetical protein BJ170DRAFT_693226 [Xylariales sp. AK1849]